MIRIKPEGEIQVTCPTCKSKPIVNEIQILSAFTVADCFCENCDLQFYQTLSIGHTIADTLTIDRSNGMLLGNVKKNWLSDALVRAHCHQGKDDVQIKKTIYHNHDQVVILNALDFLYGHVLLKLYNSVYHLDNHASLGLILIIPKSFEWLVPKGCAEVWVVDLELSDLALGQPAINSFLSKEFERFHTIYLSKAYSHPDFNQVDIARFTGVKPFDLSGFTLLRPTVTFVLREDRWWLSGTLDYWFYRLCRKLRMLKLGSRVLSRRQIGLVQKTISRIADKLPDANFFVVGLGTTGKLQVHVQDERVKVIDNAIERAWCRIYAQSHLVIGVHGSNMLLPTAHAAGCIEVLPADRYGNFAQDLSVRYGDRKQLYFYRFADQFASPQTIANHAISMLDHFEVFERNMCGNLYQSEKESHQITAPFQDDIYAIS